MSLDLDALMEFAALTAAAAGRLTLDHFGSALVSFKGDGSELTAADTAAEDLIRATISERFPDHGVFGEEGSRVEARAGLRWIVDPIDGTRSFASGVPLYGVLLALEEEGVPILGCCHFPVLAETVVAARGAGCWWGGRIARVSECDSMAQAKIVTSGLEYWRDWATPEANAGFTRLTRSSRFARTWGDCFGYMLIATGRAEIFADPACGAHWDLAPMLPIISEAGGRLTTLGGEPVRPWSSALVTNGRLRDEAAAFWGGASDESLQTDALRLRARS